jgi:AmiR/NasT family two-component response regulator
MTRSFDGSIPSHPGPGKALGREERLSTGEGGTTEKECSVNRAFIPSMLPPRGRLFTSHTWQELVDRARSAGVMSYLLKPLRPAELAPVLDLAVARFRETLDLRRSLESRKVIERAKGRLMARYQLSEDEAFRRLRRAAMDSRRPMVDIARVLLVSESVASDVPTV